MRSAIALAFLIALAAPATVHARMATGGCATYYHQDHCRRHVIKTLLLYIDAHYRAPGDDAHRASAGCSGGALNAAIYAARHPELFARH